MESESLLAPSERRFYSGDQDGQSSVNIRTVKRRLHFQQIAAFALLTILHFFLIWDRNCINALLPAIQVYYAISDGTAGLLQLAYSIAMAVGLAGVGYFGDRLNRKTSIICAMLVWLLSVAASGFLPRNLFWLFCLLRATSAFGFATLNVQGLVLLADYFTGAPRGYAILIFNLGSLSGGMLSMLASARLLDAGIDWQWVVRVVVPFAAINILLLAIFMPNPHGPVQAANYVKAGIISDLRDIASVKTYRRAVLGTLIIGLFNQATIVWDPSILMRASEYRHSIGKDDADYSTLLTVYMAITVGAAVIGTPLVVVFAENWTRGLDCIPPCWRAIPYTISFELLINLLVQAAFYLILPTRLIFAGVLYTISSFISGASLPLTTQMMLNVIPSHHRALATALQTLLLTACNAPIPMLIGALSDTLSGGSTDPAVRYYSLIWSMLVVIAIALAGAPAAFLHAAASYPKDCVDAEDTNGDCPPEEVDGISSHPRNGLQIVL